MATIRNSKDFIKLQPDIQYVLQDVKVTFKCNSDAKFYINQDMYILFVDIESISSKNLIIGDRIIKINNNVVNQKNFLKSLKVGENSFQVLRRPYAIPITMERLNKIAAQRMNGFSYFIVECVNSSQLPPEPLGISLKQVKNKAHVIRYFCPGDCILDFNGRAITHAQEDVEERINDLYFRHRKFSVVVERAVAPETLQVYNILFNLLLPFEYDVPMSEDAILIGRKAAIIHRRIYKKIKPHSILVERVEKRSGNSHIGGEQEQHIVISNKSLETVIASDVDEDTELKPVQKQFDNL